MLSITAIKTIYTVCLVVLVIHVIFVVQSINQIMAQNTQILGTNNIADYHEIKLSVSGVRETSVSFVLGCYCYTPGVPKSIEPCPVYKTVNFHRFKAWIVERDWIVNFENWLFKYRNTVKFQFALADYINYCDGRNKIFIEPSATANKLDSLIAEAKQVTALFQSLV